MSTRENTKRQKYYNKTKAQLVEELEILKRQIVAGNSTAVSEDVPYSDADDHVIRAEEGKTPDGGVAGVRTDISELKRIERELRQSEERLRLSLSSGLIGTFSWNIQDGSHFWDDRMHEIWGLPPGTYQGIMEADFLGSLHPEDSERVNEAVSQTLEDDAEYDLEYRIIKPNERICHVRAVASLQRDDQGQPLQLMGVCEDITERKTHEDELRQARDELEKRVKERTSELSETIKEQRRAEEALRHSESRLQSIMDNIVEGVVTIGEDGTIETFNPSAEEMFGYDVSEVLGENVSIIAEEPDRSRHDQYLQHYLKTGAGKIIGTGFREVSGRRKDGTVFPVELAISEMRSGHKHMFIGTIRDITERKEAEEALRIIESRFSALVDNSPSAILLKDTDGKYLLANQQWHRWFNPEGRKIEGKTIYEFSPKDHSDSVTAMDREVIKTGITTSREYLTPRADGTLMPTVMQKFPVFDDNGKVIALGGINTDITEMKRAENELSEQQTQLQTALDNMTGGIFMFDKDLKIQIASPSFQEFYQFPDDMVVPGESAIDLMKLRAERGDYGPGDHDNLLAKRFEIYHNRKPATITDTSPEGRQMELHLSPMADGGVVGVFNDVTDRNRTQEALITAKGEAETASHAKSQFLAAVSHELRTPLNAILGFTQILKKEYFGPLGDQKYREYAEDIDSSGEHLLALVDDLLDISTIEAGKQSLSKEKLSTTEVISGCVKVVDRKALNGGIHLKTSPLNGLPPLFADLRATRQILLNLLSNAIKFTPKGGEITVSAKATKKKTTIQIADTGKGIPTEKLPELTNAFIRAESDAYIAEKGWGLGLSITKSLVDLHDGKLEIKSNIGKGTTVSVTLPNGAP